MTSAPTVRSGGDKFRAKMADLNWVAGANAVELRAAVHALCWRSSRTTIDDLARDPAIAAKVLIVARGVADELDIRMDATDPSMTDEHRALRRRRSSAESLISTCDAAVQFAKLDSDKHSSHDLAAAITRHRRRIGPDDACEADLELWRALDERPVKSVSPRRGDAA